MEGKEKDAVAVKESCRSDGPDYDRFAALVHASLIAIAVDLFLIIVKYLLADLTGNMVMLADAVHSGGDLAVSLVVLVSVIIHHCFHDKPKARYIEAAVSWLISLTLIVGSVQMAWFVIDNRESGFQLSAGIPLVITFIGVSGILVVALTVSRFKIRVGKKHDSMAFTAEGYHTYSDFLTTLGVWVTLLLGYFNIQVSWVMSLVLALVVFQIGVRLLLKALRLFGIGLRVPVRLRILLTPTTREKFKGSCRLLTAFLRQTDLMAVSIGRWIEEIIVSQRRNTAILYLILVAGLYLGTGFYTVLPYQTGLELLFGRVSEQNPPGLHFHLPQPFGSQVSVDTEVSIRLESGFRTNSNFNGEEPEAYLWEEMHRIGKYRKVPEEALAMTGDENLVDVNFLCYYRIIDPIRYALEIREAHEILRSQLVHKAHEVIGYYRLDELLAEQRIAVQAELLDEMKSLVAQQTLGVEIESLYMQEAHPPIEVIPQYRAVASARENKDNIIHQAGAYANELIPRTLGKAAAVVLDAEADAAERKLAAAGSAEAFLLQIPAFKTGESVLKDRLRWETVEQSMLDKTIYILPKKASRRLVMFSNSNEIK